MSVLSDFKRVLIGKPIASKHAHHEKLPKRLALPVFASDALSSVAYASEEIMHIFKHQHALHFVAFTLNISAFIAILIAFVSISYMQTVHAYPDGGGSYTVAKQNLGIRSGMAAGAALLIDYVLTVAVSISAGVAAIVSFAPATQPYAVPLCVLFILLVTIANLRGAKESGVVFAIPTYAFIVLMLVLLVKGAMTAPAPVPAVLVEAKQNHVDLTGLALVWLFLKAFASGCTALTGIEAVANGTSAFRAPVSRNAAITLAVMSTILGTLFIGMSWLAERAHAIPMTYGDKGFMTVAAQVAAWAWGQNHFFFGAIQIATAGILLLAANTAYADFPRLASILARDGFLPRQLSAIGDRLVFTNGIVMLAVLAIILVVAFGGNTSLLVPLYAVGVFLCFTLSQFGMVVHERKHKRPLWSQAISAIGGVVTGVVTIVIFSTKFVMGAWIVLVAMAVILFVFSRIFRHYKYLASQLNLGPSDAVVPKRTTALLLVPRVHRGILHAISYAKAMSQDVRAVHVTLDQKSAEKIKSDWNQFGGEMPLVILESPYRSMIDPITSYIDQTLADDPDLIVTVIVPQAVPKSWWHALLHNNAALGLKVALGARKNVVITNVRYFLQ